MGLDIGTYGIKTKNLRNLQIRPALVRGYKDRLLYTLRLQDYIIKQDGVNILLFLGPKTQEIIEFLHSNQFGLFVDLTETCFLNCKLEQVLLNYNYTNICFKFLCTKELRNLLMDTAREEYEDVMVKIGLKREREIPKLIREIEEDLTLALKESNILPLIEKSKKGVFSEIKQEIVITPKKETKAESIPIPTPLEELPPPPGIVRELEPVNEQPVSITVDQGELSDDSDIEFIS